MKRKTIEKWIQVQIGLLWLSATVGLFLPAAVGWVGFLMIPLPWAGMHATLLFVNVVLSDTVPGYSDTFEDIRDRL